MEQPQPQRARAGEIGEEFAIPLHCRHCQDAACVRVCPTHASRGWMSTGRCCAIAARCIGCTLACWCARLECCGWIERERRLSSVTCVSS